MWAKHTLDLLEINPIFQVAYHPPKYTRKLGIPFQPTVTNAYAIFYDVVSVCVLWLKYVLRLPKTVRRSKQEMAYAESNIRHMTDDVT